MTVLSDEPLLAGIDEIDVRTDSLIPIWDRGGSSGAESNAGLVFATCSCKWGEEDMNYGLSLSMFKLLHQFIQRSIGTSVSWKTELT